MAEPPKDELYGNWKVKGASHHEEKAVYFCCSLSRSNC